MSIVLVIVKGELNNKILQEYIEAITNHSGAKNIYINRTGLSARFGLDINTVENQQDGPCVEAISYNCVYLIGYARGNRLHERVERDVFSKDIQAVYRIDHAHKIMPYAPFFDLKSKGLAIFPGTIHPLSMGSHQRAYNLISYLNKKKIGVDVLITSGQEQTTKKKAMLLKAITPNSYTYKNNKNKMPKAYTWLRWLEQRYRKMMGRGTQLQDLFFERNMNRSTTSSKRMMQKLLRENEYKFVIVNYAWMGKIFDLIPEEELKGIKKICDTHDVNFVRNSDSASKRLPFLNWIDKKIEINALKKFDYILAISESDYDELEPILGKKVILASTGFDYALSAITKPKSIVLNYGFIGGNMQANVESLRMILKDWWPKIKAVSPSAKFKIAGSICKNEQLEEMVFFDDSIELLGFVPSLKDFYIAIDVVLNPVVSQGGLNFKSVEALASGKVLITNTLGSKCLGAPQELRFIDSIKDLENYVCKIEYDRDFYVSQAQIAQQFARSKFSEVTCYDDFMAVLNYE
jgi:polysaccharide biosynthesis protein PslH